MSWFWMNIPLAAVIFSATAGIPLWMVIKTRTVPLPTVAAAHKVR
jgi:hypothetical protein